MEHEKLLFQRHDKRSIKEEKKQHDHKPDGCPYGEKDFQYVFQNVHAPITTFLN